MGARGVRRRGRCRDCAGRRVGREAQGEDLKDLYFLTGMTLVNTWSYHLSGKLARRGSLSRFSALVLNSGQSDLQGVVSIETSSGRPKLDADLDSRLLHLSDPGARAAGREPEAGTPLILSDAKLNPDGERYGNGSCGEARAG
jgi:hypothetical protein